MARNRSFLRATSLAARAALVALPSKAIEPQSSTEPRVLREPAQVTHVVDAFDVDGGFDLHFRLGYQHSWKRAVVLRETQNPAVNPTASGGIARVEVARYVESTSRLNVRAELGIFHDLGLIVRAPIILSNSAELAERGAPAGALDGAPGEPLFGLPFRAPNRSGVEYLGLGLDWGILNQWRDSAQPTLLVGLEGRFSVSEPRHACASSVPSAQQAVRCAYPQDIDRDGQSGEFEVEVEPGRLVSLEGDFPGARKAGVGRGTTGIELHGFISRRIDHFEPYFGASLLYEFPESADFGADDPWSSGPPLRSSFSVGTEIMPWELVEQFQRLSIDVRLTATYISRGQDYSELFDALGSASGSSYRRPNFGSYRANPDPTTAAEFPSVVDPDAARVFPTGLTEVEAHGAYAMRVAARWQAGPYVHFDIGGALDLVERHFLTGKRPCDPNRAATAASAGPCQSTSGDVPAVLGAPDPGFRPEIDLPGRRFIVDTARNIDAWVAATVMF